MPSNNVIQGFFPNGVARIAKSPAAAQPKTGPPAWVQQAIARGAPQHPVAQPKIASPGASTTHAFLAQPSLVPAAGGGQPLPAAVRQKMEALFGTSFADVRVHVDAKATQLGAVAFTQGPRIHFAPGRYDPFSRPGQEVLAHELAHVVQQRAGRVRNPFGTGVAIVQDRMLEAEAQRMSRRAGAPIVQRSSSSSSSYTRSQVNSNVDLISGNKELLALYDGTAKELGYGNFRDLPLSEQKDFLIFFEEYVKAPRNKKAAYKGAGEAQLVKFSWNGKEQNGLHPGGQYYVAYQITYTGTRTGDFLAADLKLAKDRLAYLRNATTVWHHYHDYDGKSGTLYLMDRSVHDTMHHYGGMWMYNGTV